MKKIIGDRLKEIRGKKSQADFAVLLGISRKSLIRYEANERKPDIDLILKLNLLFNIQPLWLLTSVAEPTAGKPLKGDELALLTSYRSLDESGQRAVLAVAEKMSK